MERLSTLVIGAFLLIGCGWEKGTGEYTVYIESSFTQEKRSEIQTALDTWERDTNDTVTFTLTEDSSESPDRIRIYATTYRKLSKEHGGGPGDWTTGYCTYEGTGSDIQLSRDLNRPQFIENAEHELGHALGLQHTERGVMNPGGLYPHVECTDLHQFCEVWGCDASKMTGCQ